MAASATHLSSRLLLSLTKVVNVFVSGCIPAEFSVYFSGARLFAGLKKNRGYRPIAVGNILRRLTSKCLMSAVSSKAAALLKPLQL